MFCPVTFDPEQKRPEMQLVDVFSGCYGYTAGVGREASGVRSGRERGGQRRRLESGPLGGWRETERDRATERGFT